MLCKYGDVQYPEYQWVISRWSTVEYLVCLSRITGENVSYLPAPVARAVHSGGRFFFDWSLPSIGLFFGSATEKNVNRNLNLAGRNLLTGPSRLSASKGSGGGSIDPTLPPPTNKEALTTRQKLRHPIDNFVSIRRPNEATCVFVLSKSCTADTWPHLTALVTIARHENIVRL